MNKKTKLKGIKKLNTLIPFLVAALFLSSCADNTAQSADDVPSATASGTFFDTYISITIYGSDNRDILSEAIDMCDRYENMLSTDVVDSDIYRINHSNGKPVSVSEDTVTLINDSVRYCELSEGTFDITIYPVSSLWNFHTDNPVIPDDSTVKSAVEHVNYRNIVVDSKNNTVMLRDKQSGIDIGGIAKGYIGDKIADMLRKKDITSAVINLGGDITVIGSKTENEPFTIGINDPNSSGKVLLGLKINNRCVATSGTYERCFTAGEKAYHHILNPKTGYPADTDIKSITIITSSAKDADALCTICLLYGCEDALQLIEQTDDTEAVIIKYDDSVMYTSGADRFIIQ